MIIFTRTGIHPSPAATLIRWAEGEVKGEGGYTKPQPHLLLPSVRKDCFTPIGAKAGSRPTDRPTDRAMQVKGGGH